MRTRLHTCYVIDTRGMMATMLPLELPISPMLARSATAIPEGDFGYEPKWDGFRCLIVVDDGRVELASRGKKPLTRYFPELVDVARTLPDRCVIDSEVVVRTGDVGHERLSWDQLTARIHPAESRVRMLAESTPAELVCFDVLALGDDDLTPRPFRERRALLESLFDGELHPSLHLTALSEDPAVARDWFERFEGAGLDGVVAKPMGEPYQQGKRTLTKIKHRRTAEAVVVGYRLGTNGEGVGSLLLGLHDGDQLVRVGGIVGLPNAMRRELIDELAPLVLEEADPGLESPRSRFAGSKDTSWVPLDPQLVVEVAFDQLEGNRFRHAVSFLRWRPDRDPESCRLDQIERPISYDLAEVFATSG